MNAPIRCEPLPFVRANGQAAAEAPPCTDPDTPEFSDVLKAEIGDADAEKESAPEREKKNETDALAAYGVSGMVLQGPLQENPIGTPVQSASGEPEGQADAPKAADLTGDECLEARSKNEKNVPEKTEEKIVGSEQQGAVAKAIRTLELKQDPEQKLPGNLGPKPEFGEETAPKEPLPARISSGMVAAQAPPMLTTSQDKDASALPNLPAKQRLVLEKFQESAFDQRIRIQVDPLEGKKARFEKVDLSAIWHIDKAAPQLSSFENASGEPELQPLRSLESVRFVEAIRKEVEVLKSSHDLKLDVVFRPDAQTELHLKVEKLHGQIQVQARFERGDFRALEAHWGTIQDSLASQGIRLEPLQAGNGPALSHGGSHDSRGFNGQQFDEREERAMMIDQEFSQATKPKSARKSAGRGWQSWA